jgi:hypothetical protein
LCTSFARSQKAYGLRRPYIVQGANVVERAVRYLLGILDVDRRRSLGRERYDQDWPVRLSVPLTPVEYDALRFLSSLYPANPSEIIRASVLRALDPGARAPGDHGDGLGMERTARVELCLEEGELERLTKIARTADVSPEEAARWAMSDALGPLMGTHRPR